MNGKFYEAKPNGLIGEVTLNELYQEVILDHNKKPRNYGTIENPTGYAHGVNPLCGDDYYLYLKTDDHGKIEEVKFEGQGCAISKSSASLMTTAIAGKSIGEAQTLKDHFIHLLTGGSVSEPTRVAVGKLRIFEGVKQFPVRVKCATLIWRALEAALKTNAGQKIEVST